MKIIGITGSEGLIGSALQSVLKRFGYSVTCLDVRLPPHHHGRGNVCDFPAVQRFIAGCSGVVHLAAVSRVVWANGIPGCASTRTSMGRRTWCAPRWRLEPGHG